MKKAIIILLLCLTALALPVFSAELYGYVKSIQAAAMNRCFILLDRDRPVTDSSGNYLTGIDRLEIGQSYYDNAVLLNALLTAGANGWGIKLEVTTLENEAAAVFLETPVTVPAIAQDELVAEYLFSGNCDDTSGNGNHLIKFNGTLIKENAALFDGLDDGLGLAKLTNLSGRALTITVWIKAQMGRGNSRIAEIGNNSSDSTGIVIDSEAAKLSKGFRYWVYTNGSRKEQSAAGDYEFHDDAWHFLAMTYDGTSMKLFIDGTEAATRSCSGKIGSKPELNIGNYNVVNGTTGDEFKGAIDNVRIFNTALPAVEINKLFVYEKITH